MIDTLRLVFSSFWTVIGTGYLVLTIGMAIALIGAGWRGGQ